MLDCWKTNPAERPTFKQMNERFAEILLRMTDEGAIIQLDTVVDEEKSYPSYMLPI